MPDPTRDPRRHQRGAALFVTVLVLVLVGLLALAAIQHSEQESTSSARSRSTTRSLHAADGGIELALSRLGGSPPNLNAFDLDLTTTGSNAQSRTRTQGTPQPLNQVGLGSTPDGYALNLGEGAGYVNRIYLVNVTGTAAGSTTELEAKLTRTEVEATGY